MTRVSITKRRGWRTARAARVLSLSLLALVVGCTKRCTPPPSIDSGCWAHPGATEDDKTCATSIEAEPNGDVTAANAVKPASCAMQYFTGSVSSDVDVFHADGESCGKDSPLTASLTTQEDDLRLCMFAVCGAGKTGLSSCSGTESPANQKPTANHLPEGMLGCCRAGQGTLSVEVNCDSQYTPLGASPSWHVYFVVDRIVDTECTTYRVGYHL